MAFTALVVVIPIFLPMAVSVVVGESIAGEAGTGTLRYLLVVPVSRTRLLVTKLIAVTVWCLLIVSVVVAAGLAIGFALFPAGQVTLFSGTQISLAAALGRLAIMVGYASLMMLAIAAIGLFISSLTEVPIAAMAAVLAAAIIMQVLVAVPQLHSHPAVADQRLVPQLRRPVARSADAVRAAARDVAGAGLPGDLRSTGLGPVHHQGRVELTVGSRP